MNYIKYIKGKSIKELGSTPVLVWRLYVSWWSRDFVATLQTFQPTFSQIFEAAKNLEECLYSLLDPSICFLDILLCKFWKWHGCKKFCGAPVWSLESKEAITIFQIYSPRQAPGINWIYIPASRPPHPGQNTPWGEQHCGYNEDLCRTNPVSPVTEAIPPGGGNIW